MRNEGQGDDLIEGLPFVNVGAEVLRRMTITLDPERRIAWARAEASAT